MAVVRKALVEDFEKVYPLLLKFNNRRIKKEDWRRLFIDHWNTKEGYFGYLLIERDKTVGFLGLIFSARLINGSMHRFCNITSGIVEKEYRNESLKLFAPLLNLKGYTLTDFTPSREVYFILKKFGFEDSEKEVKLILPLPANIFSRIRCSIIFDNEVIRRYLDEKDMKVYCDHVKFKMAHLLIKSESGNCYILANTTRKKNIPFARIHYISNLSIFLKYIDYVRLRICLRLRVFGLLVNENRIAGHKIRHIVTIKRPQPAFFKTEALAKKDIDTLYSELPVLGL